MAQLPLFLRGTAVGAEYQKRIDAEENAKQQRLNDLRNGVVSNPNALNPLEMKAYLEGRNNRYNSKCQEWKDGKISSQELMNWAQNEFNKSINSDTSHSAWTVSFPWGGSHKFEYGSNSSSWMDKVGNFFSDKGKDIVKNAVVGAATGLLTGGPVGAAAGAAGGVVKGAVGGDLGNILGGVTTSGINTAVANDGGNMTVSDVLGKVNDGLQSVAGTDIKDIATNVLSGAVTGAIAGGSSDSAIAGGVAGLVNSFGVSGTISGKNGTITIDTGSTGSTGSSGSRTGNDGRNNIGWRVSYNAATDKIVDSVPIIYGNKG